MSKEFWNERFSSVEYIYGTEPNEFFKEFIDTNKPGKLLLLGEGEGRNAVYAASKGWVVDAVDFSETAKYKALKLAEKYSVRINYIISDINEYSFSENEYDLVGLFFIHLNAEERNRIHKRIITSIKSGGKIILEAFNKNQINNSSGGPKDINLLYDENDLLEFFIGIEILFLKSLNVELNEGNHHKGKADVIRFIGMKK
jgi:SAM-dependent methyltransferase